MTFFTEEFEFYSLRDSVGDQLDLLDATGYFLLFKILF